MQTVQSIEKGGRKRNGDRDNEGGMKGEVEMLFVLNKDWNILCILYFHWRPRQQLELLSNGTARKVSSAQDKNDKSWLTCLF